MNRVLIFSMLLAGLLLSGAAAAATNTGDLYAAEVPVSDQGGIEQRKALRIAFEEVLVRVSGTRNAPSLLEVEGILDKVTPYIQQYRYDTREEPDETSTEVIQTQVLWVRFDRTAIDRLLHEYGLPVWGKLRPLTLIWLAVEERNQRYLADSDIIERLFPELTQHAQRRGVPLLLPLVDLEDQSRLSVTDLWGGFRENIMRASQRYQPEAVMTGKINLQPSGNWQGQWTLYIGDSPAMYWTTQANTPNELVAASVDNLSDSLAQRFAHTRSFAQGNVSQLTVQGVTSLEHYAQVEHHLRALTPVKGVQVKLVEPDSITFDLKLNNDENVLVQAIALGKLLLPVEPVIDTTRPNTNVPVSPEQKGPIDTLTFRSLVYRFVP